MASGSRGATWSPERDGRLRELWFSKAPNVATIAAELDASYNSTLRRASLLGLPGFNRRYTLTPRTAETIISIAAQVTHIGVKDVMSRQRTWPSVHARMAAMVAARLLTHAGLPVIGARFARHHTTVLNAMRRAKTNPHVRVLVAAIVQTYQLEHPGQYPLRPSWRPGGPAPSR